MTATSEAGTGALVPPRRLDPRSLILKLITGFGPSTLIGWAVVVNGLRGQGEFPIAIALAVLGLMALLALTIGWLQWRAFTYQVLADQVVIARGVIQRSRRSIPAERIQDVSIKQGPLARLIGLAEVRIETGGGEADEGRLDSVSLAEAHRLRDVLRALRRPADAASPDTAAGRDQDAAQTADPETVLFSLSLARLCLSGLFSFSLLWLAAIFTVYEYANRLFDFDWDTLLGTLRLRERDLANPDDLRVVLAIVATALGLGVLAGFGRTVLRDYGFRLAQSEARFRVRRGLLTRTEVVVAERQIQLGLSRFGPLAGVFGWRAYEVQTLGGGAEASGRQTLLPFNRAAEVAEVAARAGLPPFVGKALGPVSSGHTTLGLVWFVGLPAVGLAAAAAWMPVFALLGVTLVIPLAIALGRRARHRYGLAETSLQVTRGVIGPIDWTVPYGSIQAVTVRSGPLQRRLGLATVLVDTAGAGAMGEGPHIHDLEAPQAVEVARRLVERLDVDQGADLAERPSAGPARDTLDRDWRTRHDSNV